MKTKFTQQDRQFMELALTLAAKGLGKVEPNPMVGAVVVKAGRIVGRGYHRRYGEAHAEVEALREAGASARDATIYVTLEPCCHFGKQPPCTNAVLEAGIQRVVMATVDPFAQVKGKGIRILRGAGLDVHAGLLEDQARELNRVFIKRVTTGRPWVTAKWAQTLDGCVATASGESKWISGEESRAQVQKLRGRMDAIIVGLQTVLKDDPLLMARPQSSRDIQRVATRVVLDSQCRLPLDSQLLRTISLAPVMLFHRDKLDLAAEKRRQILFDRGVMTVGVKSNSLGMPSISALLSYLGKYEYSNVLVEGGAEVMASFLRQRLIDEAFVYLAPKIIGGPNAKHAIGGDDLVKLKDAAQFAIRTVERRGNDLELLLRPLSTSK